MITTQTVSDFLSESNPPVTVNSASDSVSLVAVDPFNSPAIFEGMPWAKGNRDYGRLPRSVLMDEITPEARRSSLTSNGGLLRFETNALGYGIRAELYSHANMSLMPYFASNGFAVFRCKTGRLDRRLSSCLSGNMCEASFTCFEGGARTGGIRDVSLYLPLYARVKKLELLLPPDAFIRTPLPRKVSKPIVFFGEKKFAQCAPTTAAATPFGLLGLWLDSEVINLSFTGGEYPDAVYARLIADCDPSLLVLDTEYTSRDQLCDFVTAIRARCPDMPIVAYRDNAEIIASLGNVYTVSENADITLDLRDDDLTNDGVHPNECGCMKIAKELLPAVRCALTENGFETA